MEPKPECTWCQVEFSDWQALVEHLVQKHWRENELIRQYNNGKLSRTAKCWCGHFFDHRGVPKLTDSDFCYEPSRFAIHLKKQGGMGAHLLAVALGVNKRRK